tara:strand:+ start:116 stop:1219 length:1104 start_codon:yes stop_codon:yes gene_type:complete
MIQGFTKSAFRGYISVEDNFNTDVAKEFRKFLFKFTNDMTKEVSYGYIRVWASYERYYYFYFFYKADPDMFYEIDLKPAGHYKYEIYEVTFVGTPPIPATALNYPETETTVLPIADTNGVVKGIITKGILNLTEKTGKEQVQYTQHQEPEATNYVWYGQDYIDWKPTDESSLSSWYQNKVGVTVDASNLVTEWLDSSTNTFNLINDGIPKPKYNATTGSIMFSGVDPLKTNASHTLTGEFTLGLRLKLTVGQPLGYIMGSLGLDQLLLADSKTINGILDTAGTPQSFLLTYFTGFTDNSIVITRDASNLISMTIDGVLRDTTSAAGDLSFNTFGFDMNAEYYEIQVYSSTSNELTNNVNDRLLNIIT